MIFFPVSFWCSLHEDSIVSVFQSLSVENWIRFLSVLYHPPKSNMDPEKGWFLSWEFPGRPAVQPPFLGACHRLTQVESPLGPAGWGGARGFLGEPQSKGVRKTDGKMNEWLLMVQKSGFNTWDVVESCVSNGIECHVNGINLSNYKWIVDLNAIANHGMNW